MRFRRDEARRRQRRRRLFGLGITVAVVIAAIVLLVSPGGSGGGHSSTAGGGGGASGGQASGNGGAGNGKAGAGGGSRLVRNARPQPGWKPYTGPVPILVYHALGEAPASEEYPGLYVPREEFKEEMAWLAQNGYQGVTLDEVERAWYHGGKLPAKPIVITFDNGYPEQVGFAPKVLGKYGWPGVLFEITEEHLLPSQIRPVVALGWEVDSHSATHPDLTKMSGKELEYQVAASRRYLRRKFGVPSDNFCYPSSKYDSATIAAVKEAGYVGAVTENPAYASREKPYELGRYEIEGGDGVEGLASDLESGAAASGGA